jgi:hypothetical protein
MKAEQPVEAGSEYLAVERCLSLHVVLAIAILLNFGRYLPHIRDGRECWTLP